MLLATISPTASADPFLQLILSVLFKAIKATQYVRYITIELRLHKTKSTLMFTAKLSSCTLVTPVTL